MSTRELFANLAKRVAAVAQRVRQLPRRLPKLPKLPRVPKLPLLVGVGVLVVVGITVAAILSLSETEASRAASGEMSVAEAVAAVKAAPKDAEARLALGHAYFRARDRRRGVRAYGHALRLSKSVADDTMIHNLVRCYGHAEQSKAQSLLTRYKLVQAEPRLEKLTMSRRASVRWAAVTTLDRLGKASDADYVRVYLADLQASSCEVRRNAVVKLGERGSRKVVPAILAAKKKDDDQTPWYRSSCLGSEVDKAVAKLRSRN